MSVPRPSISSGGVRNLRAMFENSPESTSSPEPRGRSPAASAVRNSSTGPSTSKVRASFVPVDHSGFTNREHSSARSTSRPTEPSPLAQRRTSFSLRASRDTEALEELKQTMSQEIKERKNCVDVEEVVPEQAIETGSTATPVEEKDTPEPTSDASLEDNPKDIVPVLDSPAPITEAKTEDVKPAEPLLDVTNDAESKPKESKAAVTKAEEPASVKETPAKEDAPDTNDKTASPANDAQPEPQIPLVPLSDPEPAPAPAATAITDAPAVSAPATESVQEKETKAQKEEMKPKAPVTAAKPQSEAAKSNEPSMIAQAKSALKSAASGKPSAISTSKTSTAKPAAKASTAPKSPAIAKSPRTTTALAPVKAAAPKPSQTAPKSTSTRAPRASTSSVASPPSKDKSSAPASSSTFIKPTPKSPTRPAELPSHLTAPTASSAAKHGGAASAPTTRKLPVRDRTSSVKPATTVKKQTSRASLPGHTAKRPESRSSAAPPDSGFLARMMRPTASSSSKTHEKTEVKSPPRRTPAPKPKAGTATGPGPVSKAKAKVSEGLAKAKDAVTSNGSHTEPSVSNGTKTETDKSGAEASGITPAELNEGIATPDNTSNSIIPETPNFEGATIR